MKLFLPHLCCHCVRSSLFFGESLFFQFAMFDPHPGVEATSY